MVKEAGSPRLLFKNLDLTPIQPILWTGLHRDGPGRPVEYNPVWHLRALMIRQLEQIPYIKDLVKRLRRDPPTSEKPVATVTRHHVRPTSACAHG